MALVHDEQYTALREKLYLRSYMPARPINVSVIALYEVELPKSTRAHREHTSRRWRGKQRLVPFMRVGSLIGG